MQLNLFEWDLNEIGLGYECLTRFDFAGARKRFSRVLDVKPAHHEAERGMQDLFFWEEIFREMAGMEPGADACFMWEKISSFVFGASEARRILKRHLLKRLLVLVDGLPDFFVPPDLCAGNLCLQLGEYAAAEIRFRDLLKRYPENGRLHGYLADALWMQEKYRSAGEFYATALLLSPQDVAIETMAHRSLADVVYENGPESAPIYGYLEGLLPLVEQRKYETREGRAYELLRHAEKAKRHNDHEAMITARGSLKELAPEIFQDYLASL